MAMRHKQAGMTMWGVVTVFALIGFFALLALKLTPAYLENLRVQSVLKNLVSEGNVSTMTDQDIASSLEKRFDIEDVTRVDPRKDVKVEAQGNKKVIHVAYEVRIPLAYNISALLNFDDHVEVARIE